MKDANKKLTVNISPVFLTNYGQKVSINFGENLNTRPSLVISAEEQTAESTVRNLELSVGDVHAMIIAINSRFESIKTNKTWSSVMVYGEFETFSVTLTDTLDGIQICGESTGKNPINIYLSEVEAKQLIFELQFMIEHIS